MTNDYLLLYVQFIGSDAVYEVSCSSVLCVTRNTLCG